jgi:hypothetical protein
MAVDQVPQRSKTRTMVAGVDYVTCSACSDGPFKKRGFGKHATSKHMGVSVQPVAIVNPNGGAKNTSKAAKVGKDKITKAAKMAKGKVGKGSAAKAGKAAKASKGKAGKAKAKSNMRDASVCSSSSESDSGFSDADYGTDGAGNTLYEVEKITAKKQKMDGSCLEYYVHWKGYEEPEWTPAANCVSAQWAITAFEEESITV